MTQDQPDSEGQAPQRSNSLLEDQQTRRLFLKAAVISGAAVAAVGAAGAAAASASPQILRQIRGEPATASGQVCIELAEASKSGSNPNAFLEVTNADWATLMAAAGTANPCIVVTDKRHPPHVADLLTTVVCNMPKSATHTLLGICPVQTDVFPAGSGVCIATGCPPSDTCGPAPCS